MPPRGTTAPVDYATLADFLRALGYATRLELLDALRFPHTLGEIRVTPGKSQGGSPDRSAARQTVQGHLEKLVEVDLVRAEPMEQGGRTVNRYQVNPQKLYVLTEELRRITTSYAGRGPAADATGTLPQAGDADEATGPRLVLVHGAYEGKAFPLDARLAPDGRWTIGRKRGLPVSLDYDPYVSIENAVVTGGPAAYQVTDLPGSKNGTAVNWRPLRRGASRALRPGDVIGVGRSLLSFVPG